MSSQEFSFMNLTSCIMLTVCVPVREKVLTELLSRIVTSSLTGCLEELVHQEYLWEACQDETLLILVVCAIVSLVVGLTTQVLILHKSEFS